MKLDDAKQIAKEIHGQTMPVGYRNVWGFFPGDDEDKPAVFVSKDTSTAPLNGIFLDDGKHDGFVNYETGEEVDSAKVFGPNFYDNDPSLFICPILDEKLSISDKVKSLTEEIDLQLSSLGVSPMAMFMVYDLFDFDEVSEEYALKRATVLRNYLKTLSGKLSMEEFSYLHHELYMLQE